MAKQNEMTLNEFESVFEYLLGQNKKLTEQGLTPIAIGVEGEAGIGKTSLIEQVANRRGMTLCKINLAQLEEVGDLTGYPQKEYLTKWVKKDGSIGQAWCTDEQLKKAPAGVKISDKVRMGYAKPAWLPTQENPNGTICLLDDYTRANPLFMQACMELINTGQYISWSLPKNTTVVLTTNPDNGEFSVSSLDSAQKTRFVNFSLKLDVKEWAAWAESQHIDGRAINFALFYGEELFGKHGGIQTINPRAYTTFCKAISGIEDWESAKGLPLILQISMGCFLNDTDNIVGGLFTTFINRRLDKLIEPQEMLSGKWETVEPKIEACVLEKNADGSPGNLKPDIASLLATRLLNYILDGFSKKGALKESVVQDRLLEIINNPVKLFSDDIIFHVIKSIVGKYPARTNKLMLDPIIRSKVL